MENAGGVSLHSISVGEPHSVTQTIQASSRSILGSSEQNLKTKGQVEGQSSGTLKNETVNRKAFAMQDKVIFVLNFMVTS